MNSESFFSIQPYFTTFHYPIYFSPSIDSTDSDSPSCPPIRSSSEYQEDALFDILQTQITDQTGSLIENPRGQLSFLWPEQIEGSLLEKKISPLKTMIEGMLKAINELGLPLIRFELVGSPSLLGWKTISENLSAALNIDLSCSYTSNSWAEKHCRKPCELWVTLKQHTTPLFFLSNYLFSHFGIISFKTQGGFCSSLKTEEEEILLRVMVPSIQSAALESEALFRISLSGLLNGHYGPLTFHFNRRNPYQALLNELLANIDRESCSSFLNLIDHYSQGRRALDPSLEASLLNNFQKQISFHPNPTQAVAKLLSSYIDTHSISSSDERFGLILQCLLLIDLPNEGRNAVIHILSERLNLSDFNCLFFSEIQKTIEQNLCSFEELCALIQVAGFYFVHNEHPSLKAWDCMLGQTSYPAQHSDLKGQALKGRVSSLEDEDLPPASPALSFTLIRMNGNRGYRINVIGCRRSLLIPFRLESAIQSLLEKKTGDKAAEKLSILYAMLFPSPSSSLPLNSTATDYFNAEFLNSHEIPRLVGNLLESDHPLIVHLGLMLVSILPQSEDNWNGIKMILIQLPRTLSLPILPESHSTLLASLDRCFHPQFAPFYEKLKNDFQENPEKKNLSLILLENLAQNSDLNLNLLAYSFLAQKARASLLDQKQLFLGMDILPPLTRAAHFSKVLNLIEIFQENKVSFHILWTNIEFIGAALLSAPNSAEKTAALFNFGEIILSLLKRPQEPRRGLSIGLIIKELLKEVPPLASELYLEAISQNMSVDPVSYRDFETKLDNDQQFCIQILKVCFKKNKKSNPPWLSQLPDLFEHILTHPTNLHPSRALSNLMPTLLSHLPNGDPATQRFLEVCKKLDVRTLTNSLLFKSLLIVSSLEEGTELGADFYLECTRRNIKKKPFLLVLSRLIQKASTPKAYINLEQCLIDTVQKNLIPSPKINSLWNAYLINWLSYAKRSELMEDADAVLNCFFRNHSYLDTTLKNYLKCFGASVWLNIQNFSRHKQKEGFQINIENFLLLISSSKSKSQILYLIFAKRHLNALNKQLFKDSDTDSILLVYHPTKNLMSYSFNTPKLIENAVLMFLTFCELTPSISLIDTKHVSTAFSQLKFFCENDYLNKIEMSRVSEILFKSAAKVSALETLEPAERSDLIELSKESMLMLADKIPMTGSLLTSFILQLTQVTSFEMYINIFSFMAHHQSSLSIEEVKSIYSLLLQKIVKYPLGSYGSELLHPIIGMTKPDTLVHLNFKDLEDWTLSLGNEIMSLCEKDNKTEKPQPFVQMKFVNEFVLYLKLVYSAGQFNNEFSPLLTLLCRLQKIVDGLLDTIPEGLPALPLLQLLQDIHQKVLKPEDQNKRALLAQNLLTKQHNRMNGIFRSSLTRVFMNLLNRTFIFKNQDNIVENIRGQLKK